MERGPTPRVLLIEDDRAFLHLMGMAFRSAGYLVDQAGDGAEGLALFKCSPADLVVIDMITPVRDGVETIVALRRADAATRIIAISGGFNAGPEYYLDLAHHLGADASLAKPFPMPALLATAERLLACAAPPSLAQAEVDLPATYDLADRLDDAVMLARLLLADRRRSG